MDHKSIINQFLGSWLIFDGVQGIENYQSISLYRLWNFSLLYVSDNLCVQDHNLKCISYSGFQLKTLEKLFYMLIIFVLASPFRVQRRELKAHTCLYKPFALYILQCLCTLLLVCSWGICELYFYFGYTFCY